MGEKAKAAEAFWKALELLPGDHYVLEQLVEMGELFLVNQSAQDGGVSSTFVRRADYEKRLREAVEKEKEAGALIKLGWKALQDRLTLTACEAFEKARRQNPEMNETLLGLGTAHLEAGRYKEAERFLVQYLDDNPQSAVAHLNLFKSYLAQDENELAWEEIQTAVRLDPDRLDALRQLCFLLRETGRREEGLEWMDRLAKGNPSSFAPLLVKAQSLAEEKKWPEAQAALEEALKRSPHNEEVLLIYTAELGNRGKQDELIRLLKSEPGNLPLSLTINLALAYSQTGQLETGKETLRQFIQRPDTGKLDQARAKAILREFER
jgi:tetratricopeptide (TPR) repeat protein